MPENNIKVIIGVDTHKDFHHVAVISTLGESLADKQFPATAAGYTELMDWVAGHGQVLRAGLEGTGSYGAGLTKRFLAAGVTVIDVIAPDKQERRLRGKTDQIDAYSAARAVLSQRATTVPKTRDGEVEAIRVLHTAKRLAVKQRTETMNQLKSLLVSAPEELRGQLAGQTGKVLARACAGLRARKNDGLVTMHTKTAVKSLGNRLPGPARRSGRPGKGLQRPDRRLCPGAAGGLRGRPGRRRDPAHGRRGKRGPDHRRISVRAPVRDRSDPRVLRQDQPVPAQPRREQAGQRRPPPHHRHPPEIPRRNT
jgi:hypothetical protein